mmetsp:Transcript_15798/g.21381  ORF Transcript_15798/g.21381 Transcript_15798/m.21381 type:complete len:83 (+) Transcript_15798:198-446(+)
MQVLINLLKNALKFTNSGSIKIEAAYDAYQTMFYVKVHDTGVGIDSEDMPSLFRKFGKLQRTAEMNSQGIGLGLTIVKRIVE